MKGKGLLLLLGSMLMMSFAASPVLAQEPPQEITVTFELTIDGQVPEGKIVILDTPTIADDPPLIFCSTNSSDDFPRREEDSTHSVPVESGPGLLDYRYVIYKPAALPSSNPSPPTR